MPTTSRMSRMTELLSYGSTTRAVSPLAVNGDRALLSLTHPRHGIEPTPLAINSVRITSKETYDSGLFIADFREFAHGPSVWPAFWSG